MWVIFESIIKINLTNFTYVTDWHFKRHWLALKEWNDQTNRQLYPMIVFLFSKKQWNES